MTIKIIVDRQTAEIAIGQHLIYHSDEKVTSRNFSKIVKYYIEGYGSQCEDDHMVENGTSGVDKKAKEIVNRYFK